MLKCRIRTGYNFSDTVKAEKKLFAVFDLNSEYYIGEKYENHEIGIFPGKNAESFNN